MKSSSIFSIIEEINYSWIKDADSFANEIRGKWGWFSDITELSFSLPFHRTMLGADHSYFVLDMDPEIITHPSHPDVQELKGNEPVLYRELTIRATMEFVERFTESLKPHEFFAKLSGTGIHLIQRADERIDKRRFKTVIRDICKPCSHHTEEDHICDSTCDGWNFPKKWNKTRQIWVKNPHQWAKQYQASDGTVISIGIDLSIFSTRRHMIRWVYSINRKIPQLPNYSIPIDYWDADWVLQHMTRRGLEKYPPHHYDIPSFSFHESLLPTEKLGEVIDDETTTLYPKDRNLSYTIVVPDVGEELTQAQLAKIRDMKLLLIGDIEETPPCIKEHYTRVMTMAGQHWPRVALVRYLSGKGYNPNDLAMFFRFHINDDDDNLPHNIDKLIPALKESYGSLDNPDMVPGCKKMREHEFYGVIDDPFLCDACGRSYPLSKHKRLSSIEESRDQGFNAIMTLCRNILLGGESSVVKKATRAGVTTSMIAMSKLVGRTMLVVTPTNKIGERTIPNALKIAKEALGVDIRGAMFAANKKACLKLVLINRGLAYTKQQQPDWGDDSKKLAFDKLHYNNRPDCTDCIFNEAHFETLRHHKNNPTSYPVPILHSEVDNWQPDQDEKDVDGKCAYITIKKYLEEIDVMFTTYSKLSALMMNTTEDAQLISKAIFNHFDVILLDEVSYLTNQSPLNVQLLRRRTDTAGFTTDIFEDLDDEISMLGTLLDTKTSGKAIKILESFKRSQMLIKTNPPMEYETTIIENKIGTVLEEEQLDSLKTQFTAYHALLEQAAQNNNIHLEKTEDVLHLLNTERWIRVSLPTQFNDIDVSLICEPDVSYLRRFLRMFEKEVGKQILVTDATLPYVDISDFLGIDLVDSMVGDPRGTNDQQLVVADSRRLSVIGLFFGEKAKQVQKDMIKFINSICDEHGEENVIIIVPNIWTNSRLREYMYQGEIPPCDMTWYRSDRTIGVECDKRVMICITAPHPPRGAHDWLAMWYHEQGILRTEDVPLLGKHLSNNSTKAAFYQTVGRAKDPECKERSVVYLFGIPGIKSLEDSSNLNANDLMLFDEEIPLPYITPTSRETTRSELTPKLGMAWIKDRILLSEKEIRIFSKVYKEGSFDTRDTRKCFNDYEVRDIEEVIEKRLYNDKKECHNTFNMFDIDVTSIWRTPNGKHYHVLKRRKKSAISS
jgi:hypothetical protein